MARPKGSKAVKAAATQAPGPIAQASQDQAFDLIVGIKVIRDGPFHGLWQLYRLEQGTMPIPVGAATSKALVINMARNEIMRMVI